MSDVLKRVSGSVRKHLRGGVPQAGAISWFDPEWRTWAEETAAEIRILLEENGFQLTDEQRERVERAVASGRGIIERWTNLRFDSGTAIVLLEKLFSDVPDFMAGVLFVSDEQFASWLEVRGGREVIRGLFRRRLSVLVERIKQKVLGNLSEKLNQMVAGEHEEPKGSKR